MPELLKILCAEVEGDELEIENLVDASLAAGRCCVVRTTDHGPPDRVHTVALDEEGARQLFNWLGVWLHTR